jgi:predicted transcriptional regulator
MENDRHMTKLFDKAIEKARALPDADQDAIALMVLDALESGGECVSLDAQAHAAIDEGLEQARRGEFASDEEIAALWRRHGL